MNTEKLLFSGFGGQGILFAGKFIAYHGLLSGKNVSWLPSYGPEMRGGTASCGIIISDSDIGSPIVSEPDILVAMNLPSLDRYEGSVKKGGIIIADSTLIERKIVRDDVEAIYITATALAEENGITPLANMIIAGRLLSILGNYNESEIDEALSHVISAKHADMIESNRLALKIGAEK